MEALLKTLLAQAAKAPKPVSVELTLRVQPAAPAPPLPPMPILPVLPHAAVAQVVAPKPQQAPTPKIRKARPAAGFDRRTSRRCTMRAELLRQIGASVKGHARATTVPIRFQRPRGAPFPPPLLSHERYRPSQIVSQHAARLHGPTPGPTSGKIPRYLVW